MRVCGDLLLFSVSGLSKRGNQRQRKPPETVRTAGRCGSAGAEKRQAFHLPQNRRAEIPPKSAQNRSKQPGPLSLPSCVPVIAHSGSQGQTWGFCLRCQLLLHTVTLSGGLGQIELVPVVLLHGLFRLFFVYSDAITERCKLPRKSSTGTECELFLKFSFVPLGLPGCISNGPYCLLFVADAL